MPSPVNPPDLERLGLGSATARALAESLTEALRGRDQRDPEDIGRAWAAVRKTLLGDGDLRWNFPLHEFVFESIFSDRPRGLGPAPAWTPSPEILRDSNLASVMREAGAQSVPDVHRWSVQHREAFWALMLPRIGVRFRREPRRILGAESEPTAPEWLPGASMNIAESCFSADPAKIAIVSASEAEPSLQKTTYGDLRRLANRVANGLRAIGVAPEDRVALYLPMTPEAVAIYLGVILVGACAVGIADTSAPPDFAKRARIAEVTAVFTIDTHRRDGKEIAVYQKVVEANVPPAVVLTAEGKGSSFPLRSEDRPWVDFLPDRDIFDPVPREPSRPTNILFSSGTTKDPKAIVWTQTTPIKCAVDAYLHHDVHAADMLAWPTSFGWMMGPWLTYASFLNRATMALYLGAPTRREFGRFVQDAGVTMLGVVPKLVRAWKESQTMEGFDWSRIRLFSSTAEPSTPAEMFYLMFLAGYRPIVEYCGGTEIGGGYLTGTVIEPCAPGTFTTPAMGIDIVVLEDGKPANRGEVFLVPPSIGLSNSILNYDNFEEYYAGLPRGPSGELLRRHGDQIERLPGGLYRHYGRIDDVININGVKTSSEEIRSVIANEAVYDAKPVAVDVDGSGQASLVVYAVPKDLAAMESEALRSRLRAEFQSAIKARLNPLLAHVRDVVLVPELPQAGPGKTRTMGELATDYLNRTRRS